MINLIRSALLRVANRRRPDFVIGGADDPYLLRWWLIPRNRVFNVYLHRFCRSDDDRALHDHPWLFNASWLLEGDYIEATPGRIGLLEQGEWRFRWGPAPHRVMLCLDVDSGLEMAVWTLFITGPKVREWGFLCPRGWRHWREFTSPHDTGAVGRGCD